MRIFRAQVIAILVLLVASVSVCVGGGLTDFQIDGLQGVNELEVEVLAVVDLPAGMKSSRKDLELELERLFLGQVWLRLAKREFTKKTGIKLVAEAGDSGAILYVTISLVNIAEDPQVLHLGATVNASRWVCFVPCRESDKHHLIETWGPKESDTALRVRSSSREAMTDALKDQVFDAVDRFVEDVIRAKRLNP